MSARTNAEWLANNIASRAGNTIIGRMAVEFTEDQARCLDTLCAIDRIYNLHIADRGRSDKGFRFHNNYLEVDLLGSMSTFDCDRLTKLVIAAHQNYVRVEISPTMTEVEDDEGEWHQVAAVRIGLTARKPTGDGWVRHPGAGDLAKRLVPDER